MLLTEEMLTNQLREAPFNKAPPLFGHCPFGGGWSKPLPRWFGALIQRKMVKKCKKGKKW